MSKNISELIEEQISELQNEYKYSVADYSIGELLRKFHPLSSDILNDSKKTNPEDNNEDEVKLFVPKYQRKFIWNKKMQSKFIESILMGVPIQPLFAFQIEKDGNLELLDGVQRLSTIIDFVNGKLILSKLPQLTYLNKYGYKDLITSRKRKFLSTTLKVYIINENTSEGIRADIFRRINETGKKLTPAEIRKGRFADNKFYNLILELINEPKFKELFVSAKDDEKLSGEKEELLTRFFSLSNSYKEFQHSVKEFNDNFIIKMGNEFNENLEKEMREALNRTLTFIKNKIPNGFKKTATSKTIPRVRFEALAVGTNLALKEKPELIEKDFDISWIDSDQFLEATTSDAANNKQKVLYRIEFVKKCWLGENEPLTYNNQNKDNGKNNR